MIVFKFGGASVKSAGAVRNVAEILRRYPDREIAVVVSAMGKTTNAMEVITDHFFHRRKKELQKAFEERRDFHLQIVRDLFPDASHPFHGEFEAVISSLREGLDKEPTGNAEEVMISVRTKQAKGPRNVGGRR